MAKLAPKGRPSGALKKVATQRQRFLDAAREAGASEDEALFDENLKRVATPKPKEPKHTDDR